jgi:hypothetical protein
MYIFIVGRRKMNFGFYGSDTEPTSVDLLASRDKGKRLNKGKEKASSSIIEKRARNSEVSANIYPKKIREKGLVRVQKAPAVKPPSTGDLSVIPKSSAITLAITLAKEPRDIGSSPHSQAKFPKGTRTGFCWREGLPSNFLDSAGVYIPGRSTIMKLGDERPSPSDLDEYKISIF